MFSKVRSVRATIGRMPRRAHSSIRALTGKQKRYSAPSAFRISAIAATAFMALLSLPAEGRPALRVNALLFRPLAAAQGDDRPGGEQRHVLPRLLVQPRRVGRADHVR